MAFPRIGGSGLPLNLNGGIGSLFNPLLPSSTPTQAQPTNLLTLPAASSFIIPAGEYLCVPGAYTSLQFLDPVTQIWRTNGADNSVVPFHLDSDGTNVRLANLSGTPVGAIITNAGAASTYTNGVGTTATGCTITPSAGSSTWVPVVGGAINSTVTITASGSGYLFPPILIFGAPPAGGIQATGICTISSGVINAVTVTNQGAGYTTAPLITLVNDPRDTAGTGGVLTVNATLVGSGQLLAMYPSNFGTALTSVPTFTFSPASTTAATAVMQFVATAFAIAATSGVAYGNAQPFLVMAPPTLVAGTRASNTAGPIADTGLSFPRAAYITGTSTAGGAIAVSGSVVQDAGLFQAVPNGFVIAGGSGLPTTTAIVTISVGGITDTSWLQPF
jgi:hypothetical protein